MYNHHLIEKKWQRYWLKHQTYAFHDDVNKPKYYVLDMFPYPSGAGLHVGHPLGYTQSDIYARYKVLNGFNVLHPIGWDAFGLPAEHFAIKNKTLPQTFNKKNIKHFREQLQSLGFSYDYHKEVDTTDPNFYHWTQWIFIQLYEHGLAERKDIEINWCPELGTALANEEIIQVNGAMVSEVGKFPVIKKKMKQWVLKIGKYADKLINGLTGLDWDESAKMMQINWIGKSHGTLVNFTTTNHVNFKVFTTRPDTLFGVSFLAIAPENTLLDQLVTDAQKSAVKAYIEVAKTKSELQRKDLEKDKTGVFTGIYAINPVNQQQIPIYVADYVLNSYATGIVMGVPAHDARDYAFAQKYQLPITYVIDCLHHDQAFEGDGKHINSDFLNGLNNQQAIYKMNEYLSKNNWGKSHTTYKIRDWIFSRQRYWGEPFPILYDEQENIIIDQHLPVQLPKTKKIVPTGTGESPLANIKRWVNVEIDGKPYHRETNTMPQWAGSSWYYIAYILKQPDGSYLPLNSPAAKRLLDKWLPVDFYDGGMEHAVLHLLYARFWHEFLHDIGVTSVKEPFQRLIDHGMILGSDKTKMSKSVGNIINPDDVVMSHGGDALRVYEMFMGPVGGVYPWSATGLDGIRKWLERIYRLFLETKNIDFTKDEKLINPHFVACYHLFIKTVTENIENLKFNLGISDMMVFINECYKQTRIPQSYLKSFLIILSCYAPHLAEELNAKCLNGKTSIYHEQWPKYDKKYIIKTDINLPIQINGKLRDTLKIIIDADEKTALALAIKLPKIAALINQQKIKKVIYVKNRILNLIV